MHLLSLLIIIATHGVAANTSARRHSRQISQPHCTIVALHGYPESRHRRTLLLFPHWSFIANIETAKAMTIWVPISAACAAFADFYLNVLDLLLEV